MSARLYMQPLACDARQTHIQGGRLTEIWSMERVHSTRVHSEDGDMMSPV